MKAIILARVSTAKQSYDEQVNDLIALAIKDGYTKRQIKVIKNKESGIKLDEVHRLGLIELKETIKNDASINAVYTVCEIISLLVSTYHYFLAHHF